MNGLRRWLVLPQSGGDVVYVHSESIVAIKPHETGAVIYLTGFADLGWIVTATPDEIVEGMSSVNGRTWR